MAYPFDELLDAAAIGRVLGLKRPTIYRLVRSGELPAVRLSSKCIRFEPAAVDRWLRQKADAKRR